MDANKAMEFLQNHELGRLRKGKVEEGKMMSMPIQHYLSTWDIAKIMVEYAEQHPEVPVSCTEWISGDVDTPHDGEYLCAIKSPQACGNTHFYQRVVENKFNKWDLEGGEELICWSKLPKIPKEQQAT